MPVYDVGIHHEITVAASPEDTYRAAREADLSRSVPVRALVAARTLPHLVTGRERPPRALTLDTFIQLGFSVLEERPPHELVLGTVGRFWLPTGELLRIEPHQFRSFDDPGYAKGVMTLTVDEHGSGSLLATETRVVATDATARRRFALYWRAIGPFSGLIRRILLAEIKRNAERGSSV